MSKAFGKHLYTLRKTRTNYTQQQMADMLKIARSTYTYYETGKSEPNQETLGKIRKILDIDFNTLLNYNADSINHVAGGKKNDFNYNLTADEEQFLSAYRSLNSEKKARLRDIIGRMIRD